VDDGRRWVRLVELMVHLRGAEGCPWDKKQTLDSLRRYILEEAYELVDAIEHDAPEAMKEEAGDLLLEVLFVSQICAERGLFTAEEVLKELENKIIRRHPHVFGGRPAGDAKEALARWEEMKDSEKESDPVSLLAEVPRALPALVRASKLSARAARVGFDWTTVEQLIDKLQEELGELEAARRSGGQEALSEELGDLLFVVVNLARHLDVDPELALRSANRKFEDRFRYIEHRLAAQGRSPSQSSLEEMERLWEEAKHEGQGPVETPPTRDGS